VFGLINETNKIRELLDLVVYLFLLGQELKGREYREF
jgi:hypothetical protein